VGRDTDVLFGGFVDAGPLPCLVEHATMQGQEVRLRYGILAAKISRGERPIVGNENVCPLELVELFLRREIGNEVGLFIGRQRSIAVSNGTVIGSLILS